MVASVRSHASASAAPVAAVTFTPFHNIWTRNSRSGRHFLVCLLIQLAVSEFMMGWSSDAMGSDGNLKKTIDAFSLSGVTAISTAPVDTLSLMGNTQTGAGLAFGAVSMIMCVVGFIALVRQGRTTFILYSLGCSILAASELIFACFVIAVTVRTTNNKGLFDDMCRVQQSFELLTLCLDSISQSMSRAVFQIVAPAAVMGALGLFQVWMVILAGFARLNAPQNLARLIRTEAREAQKLAELRQKDMERQREQLKVQHAFRMLDAFQMVDINSDGTVDSSELHAILQALNYDFSEAEVKELIEEADKNGDGMLDYQEFIKLMMSGKHVAMDRILNAAFD